MKKDLGMGGLTFISYRRDDTSQIAQALYLQLKERFSSGQLFMDANSIRAGVAWPQRIKREIKRATVMLALMGPGWLRVADQYGQRRIDDPTDWVRNELLYALQERIPIIPLVINHRQNLPATAGMPKELRRLSFKQARVLHLGPAEWSADVLALGNLLAEYGMTSKDVLPPSHVPSKKKSRTPALSEKKLAEALAMLPEWERWADSLALEFPHVRQELRRTLQFDNFPDAIEFMASLAPRFQELQHHPRWGNEWNLVTIRFTTWDAGNKITAYDIKLARMVDAAYRKYLKRSEGQ
ncbi:MAG: 4a-hydroxytetrahydrobiopterin dehydratase [Thermoanaerobaculia bacterium]